MDIWIYGYDVVFTLRWSGESLKAIKTIKKQLIKLNIYKGVWWFGSQTKVGQRLAEALINVCSF